MILDIILLIIFYIFHKYIVAWIVYYNNTDKRYGNSIWRWTYDYQVVGERDYSDLDDKDFIKLRRRKNKLVTFMYSIFLIMFVSFMSWLSKFLIIIFNYFLIVFYFLKKEKKQLFHRLLKKFEKKLEG